MEGVPTSLRVLAAGVVTAAYAWWAAGLRPFTWGALAGVGAAGAAAIVVGDRHRRRRRGSGPELGHVRSALPWAVLGALVVGWELAAYLQHPRADHPTLSSLADQVLDGRPARALALLLWLGLGADLARR